MLRKASKYFKDASTVLGDASYLGDYFSDESFDFVLAFLCDHIADQDGFFKGAYKILKKHGVLITTYPGKEIQHAIRKFIYKIDVNSTKFNVNGKEYFLPSKLYSLKELYKFYKKHRFVDVSTSGWSGDDRDDLYLDFYASQTILKACKIIGKCTKIANLVTMGVGAKEGLLYKPNYRDFWFQLVECLYETDKGTLVYRKRRYWNVISVFYYDFQELKRYSRYKCFWGQPCELSKTCEHL